MIAALTREVDLLGVGDSTYIFATSDNGFHLGELRLGEGKWNVYDTDVADAGGWSWDQVWS